MTKVRSTVQFAKFALLSHWLEFSVTLYVATPTKKGPLSVLKPNDRFFLSPIPTCTFIPWYLIELYANVNRSRRPRTGVQGPNSALTEFLRVINSLFFQLTCRVVVSA